jgi:hypothetical protein
MYVYLVTTTETHDGFLGIVGIFKEKETAEYFIDNYDYMETEITKIKLDDEANIAIDSEMSLEYAKSWVEEEAESN